MASAFYDETGGANCRFANARPSRISGFVRRIRECCTSRQSFALVTADAVLTKHQEKELADLEVATAFKPLLPREIVALVGRLACA